MQDKQRPLRALIGFSVGFILGSGVSYLGLLLFNWIILRLGKDPMEITLGSVLPMGIVLGLGMGMMMAYPPFTD